jgi:hypothetical protein
VLKVRSPATPPPKVARGGPGTPLGVRGFCSPRPERRLGFGVWKLGFEDLAGGPVRGCTGRGVGGREPPPKEGSKHSDQGSTDLLCLRLGWGISHIYIYIYIYGSVRLIESGFSCKKNTTPERKKRTDSRMLAQTSRQAAASPSKGLSTACPAGRQTVQSGS